LDKIGREDVRIKVTITGPISLGVQSAVNGLNKEHYKTIMDPDIYSDLSQALLPIAELAIKIGAHVQIDEPGLSGRFVSPSFAKRVLGDFSSSLASSVPSNLAYEEPLSIHVCGSLARATGIYETLLGLDFPVMSLGFSGKTESENMDVVSRKSLEEYGKKLGVGFISNVKLEDEATSLERLIKIKKIVGLENIAYLHPDCGLASTPRELIRPILGNMKKTSDTFHSFNKSHLGFQKLRS
jgi:methionine synthase II (cobalamin-independent)